MKNVLAVLFNFPPSNSIGSIRASRILPRLEQQGFHFHVVAIDEKYITNPNPRLLEGLGDQIEITRTGFLDFEAAVRRMINAVKKARPPERVRDPEERALSGSMDSSFKMWIRRWFFLPDLWTGWVPFAYRAGKKIIQERSIDLIYSSSPPYSGAVAAMMLQKRSGLPWVMECRDTWSRFDLYPDRYSPLRRALIRRLERIAVERTAAVITVSESIREHLIKKYPGLAERSLTIYNSFEPSHYQGDGPDRERFKIVHTGGLNERQDIRPLFAALRDLAAAKALDPKRVEVSVYGSYCLWDVEGLAAWAGVKGECCASRPYHEVPPLQENAGLLFLIENPRDPVHIKGKLFEYLAAGRPILALVPRESEAARLVRELGHGFACEHTDGERIKAAVLSAYQAWASGRRLFEPDPDKVMRFSADRMADQTARVLQDACRGEGP